MLPDAYGTLMSGSGQVRDARFSAKGEHVAVESLSHIHLRFSERSWSQSCRAQAWYKKCSLSAQRENGSRGILQSRPTTETLM